MYVQHKASLKYEKYEVFTTTIRGKTDIISVEMLVDDIEGENMDKLADNKMINKIEKLLQEARTHVTVECFEHGRAD